MTMKKTRWKSMLSGKEVKKYTVWVGGTEVTENFVTYASAKSILTNYISMGYTDAIIQEGR